MWKASQPLSLKTGLKTLFFLHCCSCFRSDRLTTLHETWIICRGLIRAKPHPGLLLNLNWSQLVYVFTSYPVTSLHLSVSCFHFSLLAYHLSGPFLLIFQKKKKNPLCLNLFAFVSLTPWLTLTELSEYIQFCSKL